jgi:hypothetical protein
MKNDIMNIELPLSVELLFQNKQLDILSLLCMLSCFSKKRKGITLEEIAFYYSIATSDAELFFEGEVWNINDTNAKVEVDANLMLIKDRIKEFIIILTNLKYIDFEFIDEQIHIKINKYGIDLVNSLDSDYFNNIIGKTNIVREHIRFNKTNEKRIEQGVVRI